MPAPSPVVFRNMLPLLTYAGLIVVPLAGIALAEHMIFPRIGLPRYWTRYKGLKNDVPAVATWGICLVFGFGLNFLDIISFYYLFLPTWALSIVLYIWLAKMFGAGEDFTEQQAAEQDFRERVVEYHAELAKVEPHEHVKDRRPLSQGSRVVWLIIGLVVPFVLGWRVMFNSPDLFAYFTNREQFYQITFWCTLIYFSFAYWDLQRSKALNKAHAKKVEAEAKEENAQQQGSHAAG